MTRRKSSAPARALLASAVAALLAITAAGGGTSSAPSPHSAPARHPEPPAPSETPADAPSLLVLVVVDQLRADLLDRYDPFFTGGLRRLRDEGARFTGSSHAHAFTETAAGHATLATGTMPARHGIVANSWREPGPDGLRYVYSVSDDGARILGVPDAPGRGPANLRRSTLGDWARASDPEARVVAISKKDRSAVTTGARGAGAHVYWLDDGVGGFVTSDRYREAYPDWVARYNREAMPAIWADTVWTSDVPADAAALSRPDTSASERSPSAFPHRALADLSAPDPRAVRAWVARTPAVDRAVLGLAAEAVRALDLGQRGSGADVLALGLSAADYVGHDYGPLSREQLDNLLRLDAALGDLLRTLDREVGEGAWALALSADHGVADVPEWEGGMLYGTAERIDRASARAMRRAVAGAAEGSARGSDIGGEDGVARRVAGAAEASPLVARAYIRSDLARGVNADTFAPLYRNALVEDRLPSATSPLGVELRLQPGWLSGSSGSSHGTPYWYDRHVPLVLMGPGVTPGPYDDAVFTWDVAPTLAAWAAVPAPDDLDGRSLLEIVGR